jgi:hypothetical protein
MTPGRILVVFTVWTAISVPLSVIVGSLLAFGSSGGAERGNRAHHAVAREAA